MKKIFRTLIPLLLVVAIIGSLVWYAFVYDRNFIRDLLISSARTCANMGYSSLSSMFYDAAYNHADQDESVAIELADQYKEEGNYTKAEYTLSNAIADGGTSELYIALCKTYVEQDKLLDAVTMLDNIADPAIKEELEAQRPAITVIDPTPGFYRQYISVTLEATDGKIYWSSNGEYPSTAASVYEEPLALPNGETTIQAVAVADSGLVSPLTMLGYTIGGVIEEVTLSDAAIEAQVRSQLGIKEDAPIYTDDLWSITSFSVPSNAGTLADLSKMNYLTHLECTDVVVDSLECLSSLNLLQSIDLSGSRLPSGSLSYLSNLPDLKTLKLSGCRLTTLSGLTGCPSLTVLHLDNNALRNLSPISGITTLEELYLQHNAVVELDALKGLTGLKKLDVSFNSIATTSPASNLKSLTWLDISNNRLTTLSGTGKLTNLTYLNVSYNQLKKVDTVAGCVNLTELYLSSNKVADILALKSLVKLKTLDFSHNKVATIPSWPTSCALYSINGSHNQIASLTALKGMENLAYVYMDYNDITSVSPLSSCYKLVRVDVYGNTVKSVKALTDQSIIVNYDPTN